MNRLFDSFREQAFLNQHHRRDQHHRRGLSLLEVVLSLAVLAVSVGLLSQLLESARTGASRASYETEALIHAESIMSEIFASETLPDDVTDMAIGEEVAWVYSLHSEPTDWDTLTLLTLTVQHKSPRGLIDSEVILTRFMMLPAQTQDSSPASSSL